MDAFGQDLEHDLVVEAAEAVGDVALDEPGCAGPRRGDLVERRVTSPTSAEAV
jgi:hypothetical protein